MRRYVSVQSGKSDLQPSNFIKSGVRSHISAPLTKLKHQIIMKASNYFSSSR